MRFLLIILALFLVSLQPSTARPLTSSEQKMVAKSLAAMENVKSSQYAVTLVNLVPPRIIKKLAAQRGQTVKKYKSEVVQVTKAVLADEEGLVLKIDRSDMKVRGKRSPYLALESVATFRLKGKKHQTDNLIIGILENGRWYFVSASKPLLRQLYPLYPDLRKIKYKGRTIRKVK